MKKYTEVYLVRKEVKCVLVETDPDATEQEILEVAELRINEDELYEFKAEGKGNFIITSDPEKYVPDFANWQLVK